MNLVKEGRYRATDGKYLVTCNECRKRVLPVVELGETGEYHDYGGWFCRPCLLKALALMDGEKEPENE